MGACNKSVPMEAGGETKGLGVDDVSIFSMWIDKDCNELIILDKTDVRSEFWQCVSVVILTLLLILEIC